jgi:carotenoid cleavage dioxygenase-like enzyme
MFSFLPQPKILVDLDEELNHQKLSVSGTIPKWLDGTLVRNGPLNITIDGQKNVHWFDGLAMLHAFSFHDGQVDYTNKFLHTEAYQKVFDRGSLDYAGFATNPKLSLFKQLLSYFMPHKYTVQNANINIAKIATDYVALTEIPLPVKFDLNTLETVGVCDYQDSMPHEKCWESAHPHFDPHTGEMINYLVDYGQSSNYTLYRLRRGSCQRELIAKIPVDKPSYMHSFAVTSNYVIFTEFPLVVSPIDLLKEERPFIDNFAWEPLRGTKFLVIDRNSGVKVKEFKTIPFFAFHNVNAFEEEGNIYLDMVCYDNAGIIQMVADHYRATSEKENWAATRLVRFQLSEKEEVISDVLFKKFVEFPRINESKDGLPYRFVYLVDARDAMLINETRPLYKVDTHTKEAIQWQCEGCYPGEPVFIPLPNSGIEDDGIILSIVLDAENFGSFLLILDAKTFQEIARAKVPHVIPPGLHSQYFQR